LKKTQADASKSYNFQNLPNSFYVINLHQQFVYVIKNNLMKV